MEFRANLSVRAAEVDFMPKSLYRVDAKGKSGDIDHMTSSIQACDVLIVGAGAAGLMCAAEAAKRGRSVILIDHNERAGEKILISGGGRCNFTNRRVSAENYLSANPHFCKSALARFSSKDFLSRIEARGIPYHERKHGQLFCDGSARDLLSMLIDDCRASGVKIVTSCAVRSVERISMSDARFRLHTSHGIMEARNLVIATGGLSIPTLGATPFGFRIAEQFGLKVISPRPGLVPLTFKKKQAELYHAISGVSIEASVRCGGMEFQENVLFTHRGLSGPAILQVSSYWLAGKEIAIDLLPHLDAARILASHQDSRKHLAGILEEYLPSRFVRIWLEQHGGSHPVHTLSPEKLKALANDLHCWKIIPEGTEGYKKAEVTVGGVDTNELSSKTMESRSVPGLFFIGEVVDVTGWLGGYNFQWAWSSGWAAGNEGV